MFDVMATEAVHTRTLHRALEDASFPFEAVSDIAEAESWRKEVNRPIYHIHKWWAQRLGSVFRAILIGAFAEPGTDVAAAVHERWRLRDVVVFDPFMGSGTTVGEALKLGARAIGRDINPVSYLIVKSAMGRHLRGQVTAEFRAIEHDVADKIRSFYLAPDPTGEIGEVLYYFWVKVVSCPACAKAVDLFPNYLFAKHAYVKRHPLSRMVCPGCGDVSSVDYGTSEHECAACCKRFNPMAGPARGSDAVCTACNHQFSILQAVKKHGGPPEHRMYAKVVLSRDGTKNYMRTTPQDELLFAEASAALRERSDAFPLVALADGNNTKQAINYGYKYWHQFFNDRQLLCLSILGDRITQIDNRERRELFAVLFSGLLEFNTMFASFKGEGTGAVRHMFSHHILKPERTPLEANLWGTPKSSGSFSTLFKSRLLRAIEYQEDPFEVGSGRGTKVFGLSESMGHDAASTYDEFDSNRVRLYLSCGDSAATDLGPASVDAVITDPPFFDNVHYSELADFFHVWQQHMLSQGRTQLTETTRSPNEVQSADAGHFSDRLAGVWRECRRVLKDDGILVFSYHHSRPEGWESVLTALMDGGFVVTAAQPLKSEMSVATPKSQAKDPIDLDIVFVCRKRGEVPSTDSEVDHVLGEAMAAASAQVTRFRNAGRPLGRGDVRTVVTAQVVLRLSELSSARVAVERLKSATTTIQRTVEDLSSNVSVRTFASNGV